MRMNIHMKDLRRRWWAYYKENRIEIVCLVIILVFGFCLRYLTIISKNIVFDYDQYEDIFHTKKIVDGDLTIVGRPIYGDPNFHHGVVYFYYNLIPFVVFAWSPIAIALWNAFFNALTAVMVYIFSKSLFKNNISSLISAILFA